MDSESKVERAKDVEEVIERTKEEEHRKLKHIIRFHEYGVKAYRFTMDNAAHVLEENTVEYLKELEELKYGSNEKTSG